MSSLPRSLWSRGRCELRESRRRAEHGVVDAGQTGNEGRNGSLRIDQCAPFTRPLAVHLDQADFDNPVVREVGAARFQIDENQRLGGKGRIHGRRQAQAAGRRARRPVSRCRGTGKRQSRADRCRRSLFAACQRMLGAGSVQRSDDRAIAVMASANTSVKATGRSCAIPSMTCILAPGMCAATS
jgi:hypothetical protein